MFETIKNKINTKTPRMFQRHSETRMTHESCITMQKQSVRRSRINFTRCVYVYVNFMLNRAYIN